MANLVISGGRRLIGDLQISGAKNAALPIIAASLLTAKEVQLSNVPSLEDTRVMTELIKSVGAKTEIEGNTMYIMANNLYDGGVPEGLARKIRCSIHMIGALLPRLGKIEVPLPGGDDLGMRKIDLHIKGLTALGATVNTSNQSISAQANRLIGADIVLSFPSVGATENIILAASLAMGITTIRNAAKEPEIIDMANFLNSMGAMIEDAGSELIKITGVDKLGGTKYTIMSDRINTGTYMVAAAITHGEVFLKNSNSVYLSAVIERLREAGIQIEETIEGIWVKATNGFQPLDITTEVYPGFPTDMQPLITPLLAIANGRSTVKETIWEQRFEHIPQLTKMGADINMKGDTAIITGVKNLNGARVMATDIRAGAALVIAGLAAKGETVIQDIYHIDRGYERIEEMLRSVGACIYRN